MSWVRNATVAISLESAMLLQGRAGPGEDDEPVVGSTVDLVDRDIETVDADPSGVTFPFSRRMRRELSIEVGEAFLPEEVDRLLGAYARAATDRDLSMGKDLFQA